MTQGKRRGAASPCSDIASKPPDQKAGAHSACRNWVMSANRMVRPCSCPASDKLARSAQYKEHAMPATAQIAIAVVGIDIGKNSFHIVGLDDRGAIVLRQK